MSKPTSSPNGPTATEPLSQKALFPMAAAVSMPRITLKLSGVGTVPSFKNQKRSFAWIDSKYHPPESTVIKGEVWLKKRTIKLMARPMTEPETKAWMDKATDLFESQLRSAFLAAGVKIQTAACQRSLIATLLPLDDCWTSFRELVVKSELCAPGQEGAEITIEPL